MRNRILFSVLFCAFLVEVNAQTPQPQPPKDGWKNTRKGNESFKKNDFATAQKYYEEALDRDTSKTTANYNLGNALYRQKKYKEAEKAFANATGSNNKDTASRSWHNLGNSMLEQKKYQESINAYKQALKMKPNDEETRYNLAYAQSKLESQKNKGKGQGGNGSGKPQNGQPQNGQPNGNGQQQNGNNGQPQMKKPSDPHTPAPDGELTKEEAQRMLDVLKDEEKQARDRMNDRKNSRSLKRSKDKDW